MVKMRIPIDRQLGALILFSSLVGLAVIAIATWVSNHSFVLDIRSTRLTLTASLKAAQMSSNFLIMYSAVRGVATRLLIQSALSRYNYAANNTVANWDRSREDFLAVFDAGQQQSLLLQARIFPKNDTSAAKGSPLFSITSVSMERQIQLPYSYPNGTPVYFGESGLGYPPSLYPNLTYTDRRINATFNETIAHYDGQVLDEKSSLFLGPWQLNSTFALASITLPIINNTSAIDIVGWVTIVLNARYIMDVINAQEGLDQTGITMIVGPDRPGNRFTDDITAIAATKAGADSTNVRFVLPPTERKNHLRHAQYAFGKPNPSFSLSSFPAAQRVFARKNDNLTNQGSFINTRNEEGGHVAIGYAVVRTPLCDWAVLFEQTHSEVWQPINRLRNILLACVFGTLGVMFLFAAPVAYFSSRPIRRLRDATKKSVSPPGYEPSLDMSSEPDQHLDEEALARKEGFMGHVKRLVGVQRLTAAERREAKRRRQFRIPSKVKDRKHFIVDELTDLTQTFNEMTDELMMQYEKLEERVAQRTAELELSKKAAEAANESKTLFIANISHELKTPLNGIMGMCAVCMSEDDPVKVKRSLGIIYKSGDLLLNLLTDLLTFSKNQVGQQLSLDEKEFRLRDISVQILSIFDKQAKEGGINLDVKFEGPIDADADDNGLVSENRENAPFGLGRIRDMVMWGDQHRILQVVINLVSNSLKFTPKGGSVTLVIRCLDEADDIGSRKNSIQSRQNSGRNSRTSRTSRTRHWVGTGSETSVITPKLDTANEINAYEKSAAYAHVFASDRASTPPPGRMLAFEFEVDDTGPGIPENLQSKIFEPFVQGDLGLSKKYGGTGLGLSICSQLATLMKGNMSLQSEVGRGSTFSMQIPLRYLTNRADSTANSSQVHLPDLSRRTSRSSEASVMAARAIEDAAVSGPVTAPAPFEVEGQTRLVGFSTPFFASNPPASSSTNVAATEPAKTGEKIRVLVAEDNKTNQEVVLRMLKLEDIYDVTVAKDGQEALDKVKESMEAHNPYNLIFMDVQMPNLDGLQSTRLIRESGFSAPIVALTAYAEEQNVRECLDSGMNFFLSKPIRRPALKHVLKTYCPPIPEENESSSTPPAEPETTSNRSPKSPTTAKPSSPVSTIGPSSPTKRIPNPRS